MINLYEMHHWKIIIIDKLIENFVSFMLKIKYFNIFKWKSEQRIQIIMKLEIQTSKTTIYITFFMAFRLKCQKSYNWNEFWGKHFSIVFHSVGYKMTHWNVFHSFHFKWNLILGIFGQCSFFTLSMNLFTCFKNLFP